ncbi:SPASM domain-containing protein [Clostridiaceae bacterium M8S5]|nr:SPASM domain-containing protein [Clostridiaceae bacterium M8S5]
MNKCFSMVEIEVNHACNRRCSYCPNSISERVEKGQMEDSVFNEIVKQLKDINFKGRVSYHFYGEPLLCTKLEKFISTIREELPEVRNVLYSNGDFLYANRITNLLNIGIDRMIVTQHEGKKNRFEQELLKLDKKLKLKVEYIKYSDLNLTNRGGSIESRKVEIVKNRACYIPSSLLVITLYGNVVPCYEDYYQKNVFGNITETHIKDIWNSNEYKEFRNSLINGDRCKYDVCNICDNYSVSNFEQFDYVL